MIVWEKFNRKGVSENRAKSDSRRGYGVFLQRVIKPVCSLTGAVRHDASTKYNNTFPFLIGFERLSHFLSGRTAWFGS